MQQYIDNQTDRLSGNLQRNPQLSIGYVLESDPVRGVCTVQLTNRNAILENVPYALPFANAAGTPYQDDATSEGLFAKLVSPLIGGDFYRNKKGKGFKDPRYLTEGMLYAIPKDTCVIVLTFYGAVNNISSEFHCILQCVPFVSYEHWSQNPLLGCKGRVDGNPYQRFGDLNSVSEGERIHIKEDGFHDEVGLTEKEREVLADSKAVFNRAKRFLSLLSRDIYWRLFRKAKVKTKESNPGLGDITATLFPTAAATTSYRERYDAKRLLEKYHLNQPGLLIAEANVLTGKKYTSEVLLQIDNQGRIIIGSELEGTVVECNSSDIKDYAVAKDFDAGNFITMGHSIGISYVEVSSKDWMFNRFRTGITRFDGSLRVHGHELDRAHRARMNPELPPEALLSAPLVNTPDLIEGIVGILEDTVEYHDVDQFVVNAGRLKIYADGIEFNVPGIALNPAMPIYINGVSLGTIITTLGRG